MSQRSLRFRSPLSALLVLGTVMVGCSGADSMEPLGGGNDAASSAADNNAQDGTPHTFVACSEGRLTFAGACRAVEYFERFVTAGATLIAVEGSKKMFDPGEAILVLEMPNAHTVRFRAMSTTPVNGYIRVGSKYMAGYEVLSETTSTLLATDGGFNEILTTVATRQGSSFRTVWYERQAQGGLSAATYRWSSDLCHDTNGAPLYADGEMCGPTVSIPGLGDGQVSDECKSWGTLSGGAMKLACGVGLVYAGVQLATASTGLVLVSGTTAAPFVATLAGAVVGMGVASVICDAAKDVGKGLAELACDALSGPKAEAPPPMSVELDTGTGSNADACGDMGGTMYHGGVNITTSGGCDDVMDSADTGASLVIFDAEDEVSEEVVVYGDAACEPQTTASAPPGGLCIISSG